MFKKLKKYLLLPAIIAIIMLPIVSLASHQNIGQYGEKYFYGHFGQPHNFVISGDFTFIVSANPKVERVSFKVYKASETNLGIAPAIIDTDYTSVTTAYDGTKYFNLVINSWGMEDGDYKLYATVWCDSCGPNGSQDYVVHMTGQNYLEFKVDNPEITPPPISEPAENTCQNKLTQANSYAESIYTKQKSNLLFIDNFFQQTTLFYENRKIKIDDPELLVKISEARKSASDSVLMLEKTKNFNCQGNLREQVKNYLQNSAETRNKMEQYKDLVINLILDVMEKA